MPVSVCACTCACACVCSVCLFITLSWQVCPPGPPTAHQMDHCRPAECYSRHHSPQSDCMYFVILLNNCLTCFRCNFLGLDLSWYLVAVLHYRMLCLCRILRHSSSRNCILRVWCKEMLHPRCVFLDIISHSLKLSVV